MKNLLRTYINEVLTGFRTLNTMGPARLAGNIRYGEFTKAQKNRSVLDDEEDEAMKVRQDAESLPRAACVLIVSDDGMVLAVSRKNDPTDLGLPGGKVDPGEDDETAAARELKEETGLIADRLKKVFVETDSTGYLTTTFFAEVSGEINTKESGVIRWVKPSVLMQGTFAEYNRKLFKRVGITS